MTAIVMRSTYDVFVEQQLVEDAHDSRVRTEDHHRTIDVILVYVLYDYSWIGHEKNMALFLQPTDSEASVKKDVPGDSECAKINRKHHGGKRSFGFVEPQQVHMPLVNVRADIWQGPRKRFISSTSGFIKINAHGHFHF